MRRSSSPGWAAFKVAAGRFTRTRSLVGTSSVCVLRHSLGSNARLVCPSKTMVSAKKTQIKKRRHNCDDRDGYKRTDTIQLIKLRKIVKEKFQDCDAE